MAHFNFRLLPLLLVGLMARTAQAQSWNWARAGVSRNELIPARSIALDPTNGHTLVAGGFQDSLRCGNTLLLPVGNTDGYVGRVDAQGQWVNAFRVGGPGDDYIQQVKATPNGDVVVLGVVGRNGLPVPNQPDSLQLAMFVARYTSGGQLLWANVVDATATDGSLVYSAGIDLGIDSTGNIYLAGSLQIPGVVAPGVRVQLSLGSQIALDSLNSGMFIARLSGGGQWEWAQRIQTATFAYETVERLAVGGGRVLLGGTYSPIPFVPGICGSYVRSYDGATGQPQWINTNLPGGQSYASMTDLVADNAGRVVLSNLGDRLYLSTLAADSGSLLWSRAYEVGTTYTTFEPGGLAFTPTGDLTLGGFVEFWFPPCGTGSPGGGPSGPPPTALSGVIAFNDSTIVSGGYLARFDGTSGAFQWVAAVPGPVYAVADDGLGHTRISGTYRGGDGVFATALPGPFNGWWWAGGPLVAELNENGPLLRAISRDTVAVGADVLLKGRNLTGATQVTVGGVAVPYQVLGDQWIRFTVAAPVAGPVSVTTPRGNATGFHLTTLVPLATAADPSAATVALWPNPARTEVRLTVSGGKSETVELRNALGQVVRRLISDGAASAVTVSVAGLPAGLYTVRVGARTARLVVE